MSEQLPPGGIYYEPRSYWSVLSSTDGGIWNQDHFRNEGRYPITFTRFSISSVNQIYDWLNFSVAAANSSPFTFPRLLQNTQQQIRVPFRQNYTRTNTTTGSFRPRPSAEVETKRWGADGVTPFQGWGPRMQQSRLNFCHPLFLPQFGSIEFGLSAVDDWSQFGIGNVLLDAPNPIESLNASVAWLEEGGLFSGSARIKNVEIPVRSVPVDFAYSTVEGWPYPLPLGENGNVEVVGFPAQNNGVPWWPPTANFTPTEFDRQEATRSGSTKILGLSVAFDALAYLDRIFEIQETAQGIPVAIPNTSVPAPLSQRIGCTVRTTNGGSGDYWWRPGAPLSAVLDSITPSLVYDLDAPITLSPGDSLILEEIAEAFINAPQPEDQYPDIKTLCLAFNGFAAIEG